MQAAACRTVVLGPSSRGHAAANQGWIATRNHQLQQPSPGSSRRGQTAYKLDSQHACQSDMAPSNMQHKRAAAEQPVAAPVAKRLAPAGNTSAAALSDQAGAGQQLAASDATKACADVRSDQIASSAQLAAGPDDQNRSAAQVDACAKQEQFRKDREKAAQLLRVPPRARAPPAVVAAAAAAAGRQKRPMRAPPSGASKPKVARLAAAVAAPPQQLVPEALASSAAARPKDAKPAGAGIDHLSADSAEPRVASPKAMTGNMPAAAAAAPVAPAVPEKGPGPSATAASAAITAAAAAAREEAEAAAAAAVAATRRPDVSIETPHVQQAPAATKKSARLRAKRSRQPMAADTALADSERHAAMGLLELLAQPAKSSVTADSAGGDQQGSAATAAAAAATQTEAAAAAAAAAAEEAEVAAAAAAAAAWLLWGEQKQQEMANMPGDAAGQSAGTSQDQNAVEGEAPRSAAAGAGVEPATAAAAAAAAGDALMSETPSIAASARVSKPAVGKGGKKQISKQRPDKMGFRGVYWDRHLHRWRSQMGHKDRKIFMGYFDSLEDAARAYDRQAVQIHGRLAKTNFPISDYLPQGVMPVANTQLAIPLHRFSAAAVLAPAGAAAAAGHSHQGDRLPMARSTPMALGDHSRGHILGSGRLQAAAVPAGQQQQQQQQQVRVVMLDPALLAALSGPVPQQSVGAAAHGPDTAGGGSVHLLQQQQSGNPSQQQHHQVKQQEGVVGPPVPVQQQQQPLQQHTEQQQDQQALGLTGSAKGVYAAGVNMVQEAPAVLPAAADTAQQQYTTSFAAAAGDRSTRVQKAVSAAMSAPGAEHKSLKAVLQEVAVLLGEPVNSAKQHRDTVKQLIRAELAAKAAANTAGETIAAAAAAATAGGGGDDGGGTAAAEEASSALSGKQASAANAAAAAAAAAVASMAEAVAQVAALMGGVEALVQRLAMLAGEPAGAGPAGAVRVQQVDEQLPWPSGPIFTAPLVPAAAAARATEAAGGEKLG